MSFHSTETKIKGILVFITLFIYGILLVRYRPYLKNKHTIIDLISTIVSALSIIIGVFIYENKYLIWTTLGYITIGIQTYH